MDRDTMRLLIAGVGLLLVLLIYLWGRWGRRIKDYLNRPVRFEELGLESPPGQDEDDDDAPLVAARREPTFGGPYADEDYDDEDEAPPPAEDEPHEAASRQDETGALGAPVLIQLSVVAGHGRRFSGEDLREAFLDLDLIHGEMGIYHRYDRHLREPQFSVASLVEPGSFPSQEQEMDAFECPGIVLFFQPGRVTDPLEVYDDLVETCHELARRLDGMEWDERRRPLTPEKVGHMRTLLEDAVDQP